MKITFLFFWSLFFLSLNVTASTSYTVKLLGVVNMVAVNEEFTITDKSVVWKTVGALSESDKTLLGEFKGEMNKELEKAVTSEIKNLVYNTQKFEFNPHGLSYEVTDGDKNYTLNYNEKLTLNGVLTQLRALVKSNPMRAVEFNCNTQKSGTSCELRNVSNENITIKSPLNVEGVFFCNGVTGMKLPMVVKSKSKNSPNEILLKAKSKFTLELASTCTKNISLELMQYNSKTTFAGNWFSNLLQ